jgi:hypothetical protein
MDDQTRQVFYRLLSTVLGSLAVLAALLGIHAHRWLGADPSAGFLFGVDAGAGLVGATRIGAAVAFLASLGALVVVGRRYYALCDQPRREIQKGAVSGAGVAAAGVGTFALAPDAAFESLGLTFVLLGLVYFLGNVGRLLSPGDAELV